MAIRRASSGIFFISFQDGLITLKTPSDHGGIDIADSGTAKYVFDAPRWRVRGVSLHSWLSPSQGRRPRHLKILRRAFLEKLPPIVVLFPHEHLITMSLREALTPRA